MDLAFARCNYLYFLFWVVCRRQINYICCVLLPVADELFVFCFPPPNYLFNFLLCFVFFVLGRLVQASGPRSR